MIELRNWKEVKAYFADLAYSHPGLMTQQDGRGVVIHYPDRKLDRESGSDTEYPLLEIEPPRYTATIVKGGKRAKRYQLQVSVLQACKLDDYRQQELAHETLELIMDQLLARLLHDKVLRAGDYDVFSINNESHDNLWGWAVSFPLEVSEGFCYSMSKWVDVIRLQPVWVQGQTEISVVVASVTFTAAWTENTYEAMKAAMHDLAKQIDESMVVASGKFNPAFFDPTVFDTGSGAGVDLDAARDPDPAHLAIIGTATGVPISFSINQPGHAWTIIRSSWL